MNSDGKIEAPDANIYSVNISTNQTVFTGYGDLLYRTDKAILLASNHTADYSAPPPNDGQIIIWSDYKVNDESKNGPNTNIKPVVLSIH